MKLSKNFSLSEFERSQTAERFSIDNAVPKELIPNIQSLAEYILQPIRDCFGSVHITSGYRCDDLNKRVGGSSRSQHMRAEAADFVIADIEPIEVCRWLEASEIQFDQVIEEGTWVHVSWSQTPRREVLTAHFDNGKATYTRGLA